METYEVLEKALGLIEREEDWCAYAPTGPNGSRCMAVAINAATRSRRISAQPAYSAVERFIEPKGLVGSPIGYFNDTHTHAEVVALFQTAIAEEKRKAGTFLDLPTQPILTKEKAAV